MARYRSRRRRMRKAAMLARERLASQRANTRRERKAGDTPGHAASLIESKHRPSTMRRRRPYRHAVADDTFCALLIAMASPRCWRAYLHHRRRLRISRRRLRAAPHEFYAPSRRCGDRRCRDFAITAAARGASSRGVLIRPAFVEG